MRVLRDKTTSGAQPPWARGLRGRTSRVSALLVLANTVARPDPAVTPAGRAVWDNADAEQRQGFALRYAATRVSKFACRSK